MPESKSTCDPDQLTSLVARALRTAKVSKSNSQKVLDELGATERIEGYVTSVGTNVVEKPVLTAFYVYQEGKIGSPWKQARFDCPPNPPEAEAELKRAHTYKIKVIAYYRSLPDGTGSLEVFQLEQPFDEN